MQIVRPNYEDCLTNLSNSILKYFGCKTFHSTLKDVDEILETNNSKNVVVILLDGMGANLLDRHLSETSFLRKNKLRDFHSVFPSTTTAATTSFLSGLNPCEHGWLGWDLYFSKENKIVTMFKNTLKDSDINASDENLAHKYYPYTSIFDYINQKYEAHRIVPFGDDGYINLNDMSRQIIDLCNEDGKKFIYAYALDPDETSHTCGCDSREVKQVYKNLNAKMEALCNELTDTTVIIIADHGHVDVTPYTLKEYDDVYDVLKRDVSIEGRACNFFLKSKKNDYFEDLFFDYFEKDFILYSKKQVLDKKIFGTGKEHKYFKDSLGEYLAIGISDKYIRYNDKSVLFKSTHAGMTADEMLIPLIVVTKE